VIASCKMRAVGIALSFIGSSSDSIGTLLQKKAQEEATKAAEEEEREEGELDYVKTCTWRTGFGLFVFGSILAFVAIGIVGPSVIVVVSAFALVVNLVFSPKILGEARRWSDWVAVFFIVVGICLAITATETNRKREVVTISEMAVRVSSRKAQAVWVTLAISLIGLTAACRLPKGQLKPKGSLHHMIFVARPAISGTTTIMLAAPTSALIQDPVNGPAWMWALPVAMICSTVLDVHFVNKSLKYNDALFHAPVCFVLWQIFSLLCGAVMYEETNGFGTLQWAMAGAGIGSTLIGVAVSTLRPFPGAPGYTRLEFL